MKHHIVARILHDVANLQGNMPKGKKRFYCLPQSIKYKLRGQFIVEGKKIDTERATTLFLGKLSDSDFVSWLKTL
ncbi:hypothetical protein [Vibrio parahaemolyticus]|uniref:hypothetical protein n=1 Tax=Vibrio parahaemolyticus TaxID=670 RepID=UPI000813345E|nr:hypothetical protein [Vibrio parahaemolyticus]OCP68464.1 hypothetical protein AKH08_16780 [Vibrio parahaemolyticus]